MRTFLYLLFVGVLVSFSACRSDFNFEPSVGDLAFSKDTVYLDTVFKNIGSSTYTLKVYNKSDKDIKIPTLQLEKGLSSKYRLMVDGMQGNNGKIFNNVELLAKDSLFIFIETTADITDVNPTDFLYTDKIQFGEGTNFQTVELVTLIQDAYFIYPNRANGIYETIPAGFNPDNSVATVRGRNLINNHPDNGDEFTFKTDKPYVVYGFAGVPSGKILTIPVGAKVNFHKDSGIIVQEDATINIGSGTATADNQVVFEGDRLEPFYSDVPGQWFGVYLRTGSKNHVIKHLILKNAIVGFLVQQNLGTPLLIENTQIYDCSNVSIYGVNASIEGNNLVVNNAGQATLACTLGGNYNFKHCTFNNYWPSSKQAAVILNNYAEDNNNVQTPFNLTEATFSNCIIYGGNQVELILQKNEGGQFNYQFNNCLVKFYDSGTSIASNPLYNPIRNEENGNVKNKSPKFQDYNKNKLNIDDTSGAFEAGNPLYLVIKDVLGNNRNPNKPDIGAYANKPFPQ